VRRLFLALAVALLALETSGIAELIRPEACGPVESTSQHQDCSSTCVRCACCAQPIIETTTVICATGLMPPARSAWGIEAAPEDLQVRDITHVPKPSLS
jgi:hypothetical protein